MDERKIELDSLIYGFLVKEKCFETAAYFLHDIKYQVENDVIESDVKLEDVFMEFRKNDSQQNTSGRGYKRKVTKIASPNDSDSDSNESDTASVEKGVQSVVLQSVKRVFGSNQTQRKDIVSNRKRIDLELFREYKHHFGDLRIPKRFTIPYEARWSHGSYGVNLGAINNSIRASLKANKMDYCEEEMSERLEMGFIADAHRDKDERIVLAFQLFIAKYGNADVPMMFSIDKNDETWPQEVRGFNLGKILDHIRNSGVHREIRQELTDIGVDLTAQKLTLTSEQVYNTLVRYKQLNGTTDTEHNFVVPESHVYPKYSWGFALGKCVYDIINKGSHSLYNEQWEALGIKLKHKIVKSSKDVSFDEICEAIECYQAVNGHLNLAQQFVVPSDLTFPSHLHGIRLGNIIHKMRYSGTYAQHKDRLAQLGVVVAKRTANVEQLVG